MLRDHSVTFWVLDTLYEVLILNSLFIKSQQGGYTFLLLQVFASIANVDGFSLELAEFPGLFGSRANAYPFHPGAQEDRICREDLASVPTSVIDVCFGYIHHSNSVAEQEAASCCLGVLSQFFLGDISHRFVACMNRDVVTDVGQREYTTYQLAISNIAFDLTPGERLDTTMKYLQLLLKVVCKHGVTYGLSGKFVLVSLVGDEDDRTRGVAFCNLYLVASHIPTNHARH